MKTFRQIRAGWERVLSDRLPWDIETMEAEPRALCVKRTRSRLVYRVVLPGPDGEDCVCYFKRYLRGMGWKGFFRIYQRKARREYEIGERYLERGISTATPLAVAERWLTLFRREEFLVLQEVTGGVSLLSYLRGERSLPWSPLKVANRVGAWLASLHAGGVYHDDLQTDHLLLSPDASSGEPRPSLIDLDRSRLGRNVSEWRRVTNLSQLIRSTPPGTIPPQLASRFLLAYARELGISKNTLRRMIGEALAQALWKEEEVPRILVFLRRLWARFRREDFKEFYVKKTQS